MNRRFLLLAVAAVAVSLPARPVPAAAEVPTLTALTSAGGLVRDTNGDGLAGSRRTWRDAVSLTTLRIRPVMPGKMAPARATSTGTGGK